MKLVTGTLHREDLNPVELNEFLKRNIDRLFSVLVKEDPRLRIRLLILQRRNPGGRAISYIRSAARSYLQERLRSAALDDVDDLLKLLTSPATSFSEVLSTSKPTFRTYARQPQFSKILFPLRNNRPRYQTSGRLTPLPFASSEVQALHYYLEVRKDFF
jgi:hypothetical protein